MLPKRPRLETFDYIGRYRYFLTFCTRKRCVVFTSAEVVALVLDEILHAAGLHDFSIPAYVFMPDHVHLLVEGLSDSADLKAFVKLAKQRSGYLYSRKHGHALWQPSYYDHVLRDDEASLPVMWYIMSNPVRDGLVSRCEDYPFLGSTTHSVSEILEACADQPWVLWTPEGESLGDSRKQVPDPGQA
jgi:REP-associated tyrosine transposase